MKIQLAQLAHAAAFISLLACASARAHEPSAVGVLIDECAERPMDGAELIARIALELALPPRDVVLGDVHAPTQVRVHAPCDSTVVDIEVARDGRVVTRRADLGDTAGLGRVWALALLVSELVRDARPPGEIAAPPATRPAAHARDDERPYTHGARLDGERARTRLGAGVHGRFYAEIPTLAAGIELAFGWEWLRVALAAFTSEAGSELGAITFGAAIVEIALRPLAWAGGALELSAEVNASAGATYGVGRPSVAGVIGGEAFDAMAGAGLVGRLAWRAGTRVVLEAALGLGYDMLGPTFEAGGRPIATLRGFRVGLALAVLLGL